MRPVVGVVALNGLLARRAALRDLLLPEGVGVLRPLVVAAQRPLELRAGQRRSLFVKARADALALERPSRFDEADCHRARVDRDGAGDNAASARFDAHCDRAGARACFYWGAGARIPQRAKGQARLGHRAILSAAQQRVPAGDHTEPHVGLAPQFVGLLAAGGAELLRALAASPASLIACPHGWALDGLHRDEASEMTREAACRSWEVCVGGVRSPERRREARKRARSADEEQPPARVAVDA